MQTPKPNVAPTNLNIRLLLTRYDCHFNLD